MGHTLGIRRGALSTICDRTPTASKSSGFWAPRVPTSVWRCGVSYGGALCMRTSTVSEGMLDGRQGQLTFLHTRGARRGRSRTFPSAGRSREMLS